MPVVALVVDDSMVIRHTICRFLEERGFAVESASNGMEALEVLKRVRPGLVITDMQMPAMGGSELISALKDKPETADIPIVILTGRSSGFDSSEKRAEFTIFKDIDIQEQLEKALGAVACGRAARVQASGKQI
jgi:CheY-like chemotaxis protein